MPPHPTGIGKWALLVAALQAGIIVTGAAAQPATGEVNMQYDRQSLRIRANNADLKRVLVELAQTADITIEYPAALERKITLNRRGISIEKALEAMLVGINHVIFYSGPGPDRADITKVTIVGKAGRPAPASPKQRQAAARIAAYQRQIAALQNRLSGMDAGSARGRRYTNRIRRLEQRIEKLERQY